jgi:hypothetical protein
MEFHKAQCQHDKAWVMKGNHEIMLKVGIKILQIVADTHTEITNVTQQKNY